MYYCSSCGTQVGEGVQFCPTCGAEIAASFSAGVASKPGAVASTAQSSRTMYTTAKQPTYPDINKKARNKRDVKKMIGMLGTVLGILFVIFAQMLKGEAGDYWWTGSYSELMRASSTMMSIGIPVLAIGVLLSASVIYTARTANDSTTRTRKLIKLREGTTFQSAKKVFEDCMQLNGYSQASIKGQECWVKGDGIIAARRAFSIGQAQDGVIVEAWTTDAIMGDDNIDGGFMGVVQLREARALLAKLTCQIESAK